MTLNHRFQKDYFYESNDSILIAQTTCVVRPAGPTWQCEGRWNNESNTQVATSCCHNATTNNSNSKQLDHHGLTRAHTVWKTAASAQSKTSQVWTRQALHRDCAKAACALLLGLGVSREEGGDWLRLGVQAKDVGCVVHGDWVLVVAEGMEAPLVGDHMVA